MSSVGSAVASSSRTLLRSTFVRHTAAVAPTSTLRALSTSSTLRNAAPAGGAVDAKISSIVDQIEKLTLLEAADLVSHLKTRLNITEIAMPAPSASGAAGAGPAAAAADEPAEEAAKPKEKTVFTLKLAGLKDPTAKAKVIREVKAANSTMYVSSPRPPISLPQMTAQQRAQPCTDIDLSALAVGCPAAKGRQPALESLSSSVARQMTVPQPAVSRG